MLNDFIKESLKDRKAPHRWIRIGTICNDAQKKIEQKCGAKVSEIHIDNSGVIHAMGKLHHNLEPDDLLHAVDVINKTNNISLSERKHKSNDVLIFKKDIGGNITFLTEVHVKNGYLLVFDAWREKKARRDPDAVKRPPRGLRPKRFSVCLLKYRIDVPESQVSFFIIDKANSIMSLFSLKFAI